MQQAVGCNGEEGQRNRHGGDAARDGGAQKEGLLQQQQGKHARGAMQWTDWADAKHGQC